MKRIACRRQYRSAMPQLLKMVETIAATIAVQKVVRPRHLFALSVSGTVSIVEVLQTEERYSRRETVIINL